MIPLTLTGRDLPRSELLEVVDHIASRPDRWYDRVRHDPNRRVYEQLWRDRHLDVWLICWWNDHDTGFHDHDLSRGAVHVVAGRLEEQRLSIHGGPVSRVFKSGDHFDFDASHVHRMRHAGGGPAVSIHAYSPPLWRMGAYRIHDDGLVERESISYAEELRALT